MRELHVVAVSEDGRSVVLATSQGATKGGYRVRLDGPLTAAVRGELRRPGEAPDPTQSDLTPKDIQARLRAGETPQQIAESAGVPVGRVERFEGPVISERARVVEQTRAAFLVRGRKGVSVLPLGTVVDRNLGETLSLVEDSVDWSARRRNDGTWQVELTYVARARTRTARWIYDPADRSVSAADGASATFAHADAESQARPRKPAPAAPAAPLPRARKATPARRTTKRSVAPTAKASTARVAKKVVAKKPAVKQPAQQKAVVTKAVARKAAPAKPVARKATPAKPVARKAAPAKKVAKPALPKARRPRTTTAPPEPPKRVLRIVTVEDDLPPAARPATAAPPAARRASGGRASVPGWADVLLGATPTGMQRDDD